MDEQASCIMLARKLKKDDHAADLLAAEISRITSLLDSYAVEIARLEAPLAEQGEAMCELDTMLRVGQQALDRLRVMPQNEKRRFLSACGIQIALFPVSTRPRFKLLWRLAYLQLATLKALGKTDHDPPEPEQREDASFGFDTRIDPTPARSFRRVKSPCAARQSLRRCAPEKRWRGPASPVPREM